MGEKEQGTKERWPRSQLFTCWKDALFSWVGLGTCEIVKDDLDVSVSTVISFYFPSSNSRRARSAFCLWEPSWVSIIRFTRAFGCDFKTGGQGAQFERPVCLGCESVSLARRERCVLTVHNSAPLDAVTWKLPHCLSCSYARNGHVFLWYDFLWGVDWQRDPSHKPMVVGTPRYTIPGKHIPLLANFGIKTLKWTCSSFFIPHGSTGYFFPVPLPFSFLWAQTCTVIDGLPGLPKPLLFSFTQASFLIKSLLICLYLIFCFSENLGLYAWFGSQLFGPTGVMWLLIITALFLPQFPLPYMGRVEEEHQHHRGISMKCNNPWMFNWPREIGIVVYERTYTSRALGLDGFCEQHQSILTCALSESTLGLPLLEHWCALA